MRPRDRPKCREWMEYEEAEPDIGIEAGWYCRNCEYAELDADDYDPMKDLSESFEEAYRSIRERKAAGGKGWEPK